MARKAATKKAATKPAPKKAAKKPAPKKAAVKKKVLAKPKAGSADAEKAMSAGFQPVLDALGGNPGVSRPKMFGHHGLAVGGKFFAIDWRGHIVVKLPRDEVAALVEDGVGVQFDPGMGRPMKEWVQVAPGAADWVELAERALDFVGNLRT